MGRLKSFLNGVLVDTAGRAHDCQQNRRHRLTKGDRRLKVTGTDEHFCVTCALQMIERRVSPNAEIMMMRKYSR